MRSSVVFRDYGDMVVFYDRAGHEFFCFEGVSAVIARGFLKKDPVERIASDLRAEFECPPEADIASDVASVLQNIESSVLPPPFPRAVTSRGAVAISESPVDDLCEPTDEETITDFCAEHLIPYTVTWELTHACNLRCVHCYCPAPSRTFWNFERVENIFDELSELGTLDIEFTGGECFTHPGFSSILRKAYERGFVFAILTNGVALTPDIAQLLCETHPRCVQLSVYSMDSAVHDAITRENGSHSATMSALLQLAELGVRVQIACTVLSENAGSASALADWAADHGIPITFGFKLTSSANPSREPQSYRLSTSKLNELLLDPRLNPKIKKPLPRASLPGQAEPDKICQGGFRNMCLSADGHVFPCNSLRLPLGSLADESLAAIWHNSPTLDSWRQLRISAFPKCADCPARPLCAPCPASHFAEHSDLLAIHPDDCRIGMLHYDAFCKHNKRYGGNV